MKFETLSPEGKVVDGARCQVSNDRNDAVVRSGQTLPVRRSGENLSIECTQAGLPPARGQAISRVNVGLVGNVMIGGLIGVAIDTGTGAGFNYPSWIRLIFGEVRSFDRTAQTGDEATVGMKIGTTELAAAPAPKTAAAPVPGPAPAPAAVAPPPPPPVAVAPAAPARPAPAAPSAAPDARVSMDDLRGLLPAKP
ncbi:hypothetical protein [Variovorax sp. 38R]|uniref:hypothetical protein n=1 Tax=Variovorax sp. 38R TaxID=2774875 RepID=UPI0017857E87|nr:hypothetical protein [Variovorax sp. 38R]QOF77934.1 hypothetical protein IG196_27020 [Variovorax sp. 38R]